MHRQGLAYCEEITKTCLCFNRRAFSIGQATSQTIEEGVQKKIENGGDRSTLCRTSFEPLPSS